MRPCSRSGQGFAASPIATAIGDGRPASPAETQERGGTS